MTHERTRRPHWTGAADHPKSQPEHQAGLGAFSEIFLSSSKLVMIQAERSWQPPTDVYETENEVVIKSEIAGIKPEEVMISIESDHISIRGVRYEKTTAHVPGKRNFRQMEINYGKFERVIRLDGHINPENVQAHYKDGFLEIVIPKSKQKRVIAYIEIHCH